MCGVLYVYWWEITSHSCKQPCVTEVGFTSNGHKFHEMQLLYAESNLYIWISENKMNKCYEITEVNVHISIVDKT